MPPTLEQKQLLDKLIQLPLQWRLPKQHQRSTMVMMTLLPPLSQQLGRIKIALKPLQSSRPQKGYGQSPST